MSASLPLSVIVTDTPTGEILQGVKMTTYHKLMVQLDEMVKERVTAFFVMCAVQDITPIDLGDEVMDGIGEALKNLTSVAKEGELPTENNYRAMQILAEYLTIVKLQNDALLVMPGIAEGLRTFMLESGDEIISNITTMAHLE